jgi:hypothetical protein
MLGEDIEKICKAGYSEELYRILNDLNEQIRQKHTASGLQIYRVTKEEEKHWRGHYLGLASALGSVVGFLNSVRNVRARMINTHHPAIKQKEMS